MLQPETQAPATIAPVIVVTSEISIAQKKEKDFDNSICNQCLTFVQKDLLINQNFNELTNNMGDKANAMLYQKPLLELQMYVPTFQTSM